MYRHTDGIDFMRHLPDESVDGIFTDPPWGSDLKHKITSRIPGCDKWKELLGDLNEEAPRILKPGGRVLIWVGARIMGDVIKILSNLEYRWFIVCHYIGASRFCAVFIADIDPILYFAKPGDPWPKRGSNFKLPFLKQTYRNISGSNRHYRSDHPCPRPYRVVKEIIGDWFDPGEYIMDPFAGSDTTGYACRNLEIRSDTCEIDQKLYQTGLNRHAQGLLFEQGEGQ